MDISADKTKFGSNDARLDAARRHDTTGHAVLAPLVIDDIARAELGKSEKAGAIDRVCLGYPGYQGADRQPREIVAGDEALVGEVTVGVEIGFGRVRAVEQHFDLPPRLPFALLCHFLLTPVAKPRVIDDASCRIALFAGGAVQLAPTIERSVEFSGARVRPSRPILPNTRERPRSPARRTWRRLATR